MAILELRFEAADGITNESLKDAKSALKENFPVHNFTTDTQFELRPDQVKTTVQLKSSHISGNIFFSASRKHEITLSTKSYNFKQHGEYTTWTDFCNSALAGWEQCKSFIRPKSITWMSLRYINNIEIASPNNQPIPAESLFKTFIANEGKNKTQGIAAYALRYTHFHETKNIMVHFGQELLQGQPGMLPFIVDIDVIHNKVYSPTQLDIKEKFDELRQVKNEYFFDNLTPNTLEILK